jgi:NAD(P)-dependent dehydrogenase (short-subunit alcohol dehydrogenase family)
MSFDGKTIVITGGSSGIGLATAGAAIAKGAEVVITGRDRERLDRALSQLGSRARGFAVDASDEKAVRGVFVELPHVDHIFSNAGGITGASKLLSTDVAAMRPAMDIRFWGAIYAAKYGVPKMREGGSIVLMSGIASQRPIPGAVIASASGSSVEGLARSLAVDLAPIRVNTIRPGLIDTPLIDQFVGERKDAFVKMYAERVPVRRIGRADEIAEAVLFLMSNGFVNGITLTVDGGALLI